MCALKNLHLNFLLRTKYSQLQVFAMVCIHILFQTSPPTNVRDINFEASTLKQFV
jgi:hypothetical protein